MPSASSFPAAHSAERRYVVRTLSWMALYVLLNLAAIAGVFDAWIGRPIAWVLALAVAVPVAGQIAATLRLISESDEFLRILWAKRFILAAGATLALWSAWGFGESYAGAPHLKGLLIYPLFWAVFAVVSPFVRSSR